MRAMERQHRSGFTLIEVMIVGVLTVVLSAGVFGLQYILTQNQLTAYNSYTAVEEANTILTYITTELRAAGNSENGAYLLESVGDNELIFYSDVDFDGTIERVRYTLTGNVLERGTIEPSGFPAAYLIADEIVRPLSENIDTEGLPLFYYFNEDWPIDIASNPLLLPSRLSDTRLVRVALIISIESDIGGIDKFEIESYVQPRLLKTNL